MAWKLAVAWTLAVAGLACAQEQAGHPQPSPRQAPKPIAPTTVPKTEPRDESIPGLEDSDFRIAAAPLRREGAFVQRQRGSLVRLPGGEKVIVFHKDASGVAERPMVLLPCLTLHSMEQMAGDGSRDAAFVVTGEVYVYHNVNYLLPTAAPMASQAELARPEVKDKKEEPSRATDPAVDDLIRELDAQRGRPRTLGSTKEATPGATDLLPEKSLVSLRKGRLVRMANGEWGFAIDNAPGGEAAADRTMVLSPCSNLERLEGWASHMGEGASVQISGRVFQYQGRNYLIPTMYQVSGVSELSPRQ